MYTRKTNRALRRFAAILLCGTLAVGTLGCSSGDISLEAADEKTDISFSWWGTDPRHDYTMEAIKIFERQNPDIDVHMEYTEWSGYDKKSAIQMAAHTEADVMQINFSWLDKFSPEGEGYYDLNSLKGSLNLSGFNETQLEYGTNGGILNALPIALNSKVCLYNKDLYESYGLELPKTWDDFFAAAKVMKKDQKYPFDLDQVCAFMFSAAYVEQQNGKSFTTEDNKLGFNADDVKEMIRFYMSLVDAGVVPFVAERDDANYKNAITGGTAVWITSAGGYETDLMDTSGNTTVVAPNPIMADAKRSGWYVKPASFYSISKHTEHPEAAAKLLDFLVNGSEMAKLQGLEKGVPVSTQARDALDSSGSLSGIQVDSEAAMYESDVNPMSSRFEDVGLQDAFVKAVSSMKYDGVSLDAAAKSAYDAMKEVLK